MGSRFNPKFQALVKLLRNNRQIVKEMTTENPNLFKDLAKSHTPKFLMIGCADARIQPNSLLGLHSGELFIHRNIANQVFQGDLNANAVIQYAVEGLNIDHIIVMGHSQCGGIKASMQDIDYEIVDQWLSSVREIYQLYADFFAQIKDPEEKATVLSKINIRHQCMNIQKSAVVRKAISKGRNIQIHGWYLDIKTGFIDELLFNNDYTNLMQEIYSDTLFRLSSIDGSSFSKLSTNNATQADYENIGVDTPIGKLTHLGSDEHLSTEGDACCAPEPHKAPGSSEAPKASASSQAPHISPLDELDSKTTKKSFRD